MSTSLMYVCQHFCLSAVCMSACLCLHVCVYVSMYVCHHICCLSVFLLSSVYYLLSVYMFVCKHFAFPISLFCYLHICHFVQLYRLVVRLYLCPVHRTSCIHLDDGQYLNTWEAVLKTPASYRRQADKTSSDP